jgi:hypothetical protein
MKVVRLFDRTQSACHWGVKDVLQTAMDDLTGEEKKAIVITLDDHDGYKVSFTQAGMTAGQMIQLLEIAKMNIYNDFMKNE